MSSKNASSYILSLGSFLCFCVALCLMILIRIFAEPDFILWYNNYTDTLVEFEQWMQTYGASWISVVLILFNFTLKALIPWFPIPCMCVASGVVFKWYWAITINCIGIVIIFTIRYFWGKRYGGGNAEKILSKYDVAHNFIDKSKLGSSIVLFVLRLFPSIPTNSVSRLYGTTDIKYNKYIIISVLGFTYKLISYTVIGRNVFDPLSISFVLPFVLLFLFSGVVLMGLNGVVGISIIGKKFYMKIKDK